MQGNIQQYVKFELKTIFYQIKIYFFNFDAYILDQSLNIVHGVYSSMQKYAVVCKVIYSSVSNLVEKTIFYQIIFFFNFDANIFDQSFKYQPHNHR